LDPTTDYSAPSHERCIIWNDPDLGIRWPLAGPPILSAKDAAGLSCSVATAAPSSSSPA
ncbi:MAG: dTDP-4-dehydrorhamnose 3,5-epimerase family protein, partial [Planctomycetia bacterium]